MKRTVLAMTIGALCAGLSAGVLAEQNGQNTESQMEHNTQGQMGQDTQGQMGQDTQNQMGQQQGQMGQQHGNLMSMQASELEGKEVVNQNGEELGEVERIAVSNNQVYAIVSVGGFLGMGDESIALPLQEMNWQQDQLVLKTNRSEDELKQSAKEYNEENYRQVEGNTTLSDAARGGGTSSGGTSSGGTSSGGISAGGTSSGGTSSGGTSSGGTSSGGTSSGGTSGNGTSEYGSGS